jgi:galactokinase
VGTIINSLFFEGKATMPEIAAIGQYAENVYFGKPCGLMDQMASAVGGLVAIDFAEQDKPVVQSVDFDFSTCGHALCIIDTHASHADLTEEYAAVPGEMKAVAAYFGKDVLTQVPADEFYAAIPALREQCGDRAVLRSIHFYEENQRVVKQAAALRQGDFPAFLALIKESGRSSWLYLQNVIVCGSVAHQDVALALALCEKYLQGRGAYRVHGGGFAGTVQAFVPFDLLDDFRSGLEAVLGQDSCHVLTIRPIGGTELKSEELA